MTSKINFKRLLQETHKKDYVLLAVYAIVSLFLHAVHEPWKDEAHAWLIARDSVNLLKDMGYEGTPGLWHLILTPFAKIGMPYTTMFIIHYIIMMSAVCLFVLYSPFPRYIKTLFIFGYFPLFEYNVIARSYSLSVLLLFILATLHKSRMKYITTYCILLALLANTNTHSFIIAGILSALFLFDSFIKKNHQSVLGIIIIASGFIAALLQLFPPADLAPDLKGWTHNQTLLGVLNALGKSACAAFIPIPELKLNFWNTIFQLQHVVYFALLLLILSVIVFWPNKRILAVYLLGFIGLEIVFVYKFFGSVRHHGLIYILFIFCLWIAITERENLNIKTPPLISPIFYKATKVLLTTILFIHITAACVAVYFDTNYAFSSGQQVASFLKQNGYVSDKTLIVTYNSFEAESILPYLPRGTKFLFGEYADFRTYLKWDTIQYEFHKDRRVFNYSSFMDTIDAVAALKDYSDIIVILNFNVNKQNSFSQRYSLVYSNDKTIVMGERYYVYKLNK